MNRIMISIRKWPYISILIFMVLLAGIMWWLSSLLQSDDLAREVLINLSASFLAVIPPSFLLISWLSDIVSIVCDMLQRLLIMP